MQGHLRRIHAPAQDGIAFLLCDIQEGFRKVWPDQDKVTRVASKMIDASKALNIPLIVTEQNPAKLGKTLGELDISSARILASKMTFSMWTKGVSEYFINDAKNIRSVVLFGIETHVCIYQTALDFLANNFQVFVLADGVDSMNPQEVPIALEQLRANGALVTSSDSILFQILKTAEHPSFRTISQIVKRSSKL